MKALSAADTVYISQSNHVSPPRRSHAYLPNGVQVSPLGKPRHLPHTRRVQASPPMDLMHLLPMEPRHIPSVEPGHPSGTQVSS